VLPKENILITPGAIQANFLLLYTLVGPGDHVICHYPTYQQLYSVPASMGAEVSLWKSKETDGWQLDLEELKSLIRPNTKLIIIKFVMSLAELCCSAFSNHDSLTATRKTLPEQSSRVILSKNW
jgi:DNA-binding transcriptional MocR family regulator